MSDDEKQKQKDYEKLTKLSNYIYQECKSLGFYDGDGNTPSKGPARTISEKVCDDNVWSATAADDQAAIVQMSISDLGKRFTDLHQAVKSQAAAKKPKSPRQIVRRILLERNRCNNGKSKG
jgi:hypothetical protein